MTLQGRLAGLAARFDGLALRPPAAEPGQARLQADRPGPWQALEAWCWTSRAGTSTGPQAGRALGAGLAVAALDGEDAEACRCWVDAFARQLDGSSRLDALPGRAAGLAWRLQIQLLDTLAWRARRTRDPWDAGWALSSPAALDRWRAHFMPRRPTLVLADAADFPALQPALAGLAARSLGWRQPVRWLWVGRGDPAQASSWSGPMMERFSLHSPQLGMGRPARRP